jgi:hypothetical protein
VRANRPNITRVTEQPVSDNNAKRPAASVSPFGTIIEQVIQLRYRDLPQITRQIETEIKQEENGTHADEVETFMTLFIAPWTTDIRGLMPGAEKLWKQVSGLLR